MRHGRGIFTKADNASLNSEYLHDHPLVGYVNHLLALFGFENKVFRVALHYRHFTSTFVQR